MFGSILHESKIIAATNLPQSVFRPLLRVTEVVNKAVSEGESFRGKTVMEGIDVYVVADPIVSSSGEVIGGIAVGIYASEVNRLIRGINREIFIYTSVGIIFSLILAGLAYRDTAMPINALVGAMDEAASGNLDVETYIKTKDEFEKMGERFNHMVDTIKTREGRLARFNELSKLLITSLDPEILLNKALTKVVELTASHMGIVYLNDEDNALLKPVAVYGVGENELRTIKIGEGLPGMCPLEKKAVVLKDIPEDAILLDAGFAKVKPKGVAWFAMCYKEKLLGVFAIGSIETYNEDEIRHLEYLVAQIAIALDNAVVHKEVETLSITDSLTGLYNRRYFFSRLNAEFAEAKRYNHPLSIVIMDIDDFKGINDKLGHQQGDAVLKEIGQILKEETRIADLWARYGGEEFIGYLPHCGKAEAVHLTEKLRKTIEEYAFGGMDRARVTVSIGVGYYPYAGIETIDHLVGVADGLLYKAKGSGKNRVMVA